jgi:hypothetical protein
MGLTQPAGTKKRDKIKKTPKTGPEFFTPDLRQIVFTPRPMENLVLITFFKYHNIMSGDTNISDITGKKIFFLYPSAIIQNEIAAELVQQEFEVYIVRDHLGLRRILKKYPDSIVFANIDDQMDEKSWEAWIRGIMSDEATANVGIGILSTTDDMALQRKYVNSIKIKCGFIHVKKDIKESIIKVMEILKVADAKGRRKYIRATTDNETLTTINLPHNGDFVKGVIKDISVAGLSCAFPIDPVIEKNSLIKDIQIKLQSLILKAEGIVFGSRMDGITKIYVIIFTQRTDPNVRAKIRKYIQANLQAKLDMAMR